MRLTWKWWSGTRTFNKNFVEFCPISWSHLNVHQITETFYFVGFFLLSVILFTEPIIRLAKCVRFSQFSIWFALMRKQIHKQILLCLDSFVRWKNRVVAHFNVCVFPIQMNTESHQVKCTPVPTTQRFPTHWMKRTLDDLKLILFFFFLLGSLHWLNDTYTPNTVYIVLCSENGKKIFWISHAMEWNEHWTSKMSKNVWIDSNV